MALAQLTTARTWPESFFEAKWHRTLVDPAAGLPSRVLAHAPSATRTVAGSSSAATGCEARAAQSRAAAMCGGGVMSRVAGLNAQPNSACRSTFGSGAPGSFLLRAMVTVTRASATDRRDTGARFAHLASVAAARGRRAAVRSARRPACHAAAGARGWPGPAQNATATGAPAPRRAAPRLQAAPAAGQVRPPLARWPPPRRRRRWPPGTSAGATRCALRHCCTRSARHPWRQRTRRHGPGGRTGLLRGRPPRHSPARTRPLS